MPSLGPSSTPSARPSANPSTFIEISSLTELSDAIESSQFGSVLAFLSGNAVSCRGSTLLVPGGNTPWVFRLFGPGSVSNCTFDVQHGADFFLGNDVELSNVLFVISGHVALKRLYIEADENVQFVQSKNGGGSLTIEDASVFLSVCNEDMNSYQTNHCYRVYDYPFQSREAAKSKCEVETEVSLGIFDPSTISNVLSNVGLRIGLWTGARLDPSKQLLVWENGDAMQMSNSSWWSSNVNTGETLRDLCAIIQIDGNIQAVQCEDDSTRYGSLCSMTRYSLFTIENMDATTSTNANWVSAVNTSFVLPNWASATSSIEREVPTTCENCSIAVVDVSSQPSNEEFRRRRLASMDLDYLFGTIGSVDPFLLISGMIGDGNGSSRLLRGTEGITESDVDVNRIAFDDEAYGGFEIVVEIHPTSSGDPDDSPSPHSIVVDTVQGARSLTRDTKAPGWVFRAAFPDASLPAFVHFHSEQDNIYVVRMIVEIILADYRGDTRTFLLSSQEMSHFRDCEGGIVCSPAHDDDATCFRIHEIIEGISDCTEYTPYPIPFLNSFAAAMGLEDCPQLSSINLCSSYSSSLNFPSIGGSIASSLSSLFSDLSGDLNLNINDALSVGNNRRLSAIATLNSPLVIPIDTIITQFVPIDVLLSASRGGYFAWARVNAKVGKSDRADREVKLECESAKKANSKDAKKICAESGIKKVFDDPSFSALNIYFKPEVSVKLLLFYPMLPRLFRVPHLILGLPLFRFDLPKSITHS